MRVVKCLLGLQKFDYFLHQADQKINFYEPTIMNETNPYNPFKFEAEFQVNVVDDGKFEQIREAMKKTFNIAIDDILAVEVNIELLMIIVQGCINDDKTILGGRNQFLSHFCTLFNFNICYANLESKAMKKTQDLFNDHEELNKKVDEWIRKFDEIK